VDQKQYGSFEVIDTATGTVLSKLDDPDPWPTNGMAYSTRMALSGDGRWLWHHAVSATGFRVLAFDTERGVSMGSTRLPQCGAATLLPLHKRNAVYVTCSDEQLVHVLTLNESGTQVERTPLRIHGGDQFTKTMAASFLNPNEQVLTVIKGDGRFLKTETRSGRQLARGAIDKAARGVPSQPDDKAFAAERRAVSAEKPDDWLGGRQVRPQLPPRSRDGSRVYLLVATGKDTRAVKDSVVVLNAETLERVLTIPLGRPCVSLSLSQDERQLYAVDRLGSSILVLDADSGRLLRTIEGVGQRPVYAVVAP
jgi:DNA-binding beta-propeller fold protein YncE